MADRGAFGTQSSHFRGQTLGPGPDGHGDEVRLAFGPLFLVGVAGRDYGLVRRKPLVVLAGAAAMRVDRKSAFGGRFA